MLVEEKVVKGIEFLRKLNRLAAEKGASIRFIADQGHGARGRVYLGIDKRKYDLRLTRKILT